MKLNTTKVCTRTMFDKTVKKSISH